MSSVYDFSLKRITGENQSLGEYDGKVLLIVNVASKCGLTPHYNGLQKLYEQYADRGLEVLGFPCNQFGAQEPGSEADIQEFCTTNFSVSFPMFSKVEVNGPGRDPLYGWLTSQSTEPDGPGDIKWNFAKFLVGRDGQVIARFAPTVEPEAPELKAAVEKALG
ncbi:MAG: glutathione peroxidase [Myxococcales bacterium]|nr:glutathione peroxidase [Myxococcales bacterium]